MLRFRLENNFNKERSDENWDTYKKQSNLCVKLLRQAKKKYFSDINVKSILTTKNSGKPQNHFFQ